MLYISNSGEVQCGKNARHGGAYLVSMIKADPEAEEITTPLDVWKQVPDFVAWEFGLACETCEAERSTHA